MADADPQRTFNVHDAKTHLSRLIDRAHAGEEIILAKAGAPMAKIVPIEPLVKRHRTPGGLRVKGKVDWAAFDEPLDDENLRYIDDRPEAERR